MIMKQSNRNNRKTIQEDIEMKDINLDQLGNVTGGTSPKYPPMRHTESMGNTNTKSIFPVIGRHSIPRSVQAYPILDTIKDNIEAD